jgi:hypothetical protein
LFVGRCFFVQRAELEQQLVAARERQVTASAQTAERESKLLDTLSLQVLRSCCRALFSNSFPAVQF